MQHLTPHACTLSYNAFSVSFNLIFVDLIEFFLVFIIVFSLNLNLYRSTSEQRSRLLFFCHQHTVAAFSGENRVVAESLVENGR